MLYIGNYIQAIIKVPIIPWKHHSSGVNRVVPQSTILSGVFLGNWCSLCLIPVHLDLESLLSLVWPFPECAACNNVYRWAAALWHLFCNLALPVHFSFYFQNRLNCFFMFPCALKAITKYFAWNWRTWNGISLLAAIQTKPLTCLHPDILMFS